MTPRPIRVQPGCARQEYKLGLLVDLNFNTTCGCAIRFTRGSPGILDGFTGLSNEDLRARVRYYQSLQLEMGVLLMRDFEA